MYEKLKKWFKEKFIPFIKKYWGYIVAFIGGVLLTVGFNRGGNSRARKDLELLRLELAEYGRLNKRLEDLSKSLQREIDEGRKLSDDAIEENRLLREEIERSRIDLKQLEYEMDELRREADRSGEITERLSTQSGKIGEGIDRLREFLDKYGAHD